MRRSRVNEQAVNEVKQPKLMRAVKLLRQRRPNSPDQYRYAFQSALDKLRGVTGYRWSQGYCSRGYPYARIVILLTVCSNCKTTATAACVAVLLRELELDNLHIVVTHSSSAFWTMCDCPITSCRACTGSVDVDDDDDCDDDDEHDDDDGDDDDDDDAARSISLYAAESL